MLGSLVLLWPPFLISLSVGIAWVLGAILYAAFSAYAHQLQHENPLKCSWMTLPVHYVHHKYGMWHHNFGLAVDWWDRIFGTYQSVDWLTEAEDQYQGQSRWQLRWW